MDRISRRQMRSDEARTHKQVLDSMEDDKEHPQDLPPPYTGPPANYGDTNSAPQPGFMAPPYQEGPSPTICLGVPAVTPAGSQVVLMPGISGLSDLPSQTQCPHCQQLVLSRTNHKPGLLTWLIVGSLFFVGCWPCCCIPFCVNDCQDVEHRCPNCNNLIYVYNRI
ncbi:hypothetical protein AAFF_G00419300 [Aldrovandia affinis]|uniref:LITAF domain-containing protein n=1 Tax=Aldrovandia affinis TaxID=143900 RepID=A0AAD7SAF3_9TELE|nr:hypothetical protein AAFF_G00419300 [Aldrovandia affinis]